MSGTSIWCKFKPFQEHNPPHLDLEGRVTTIEFAEFILVNVYTPNSQKLGSERCTYRTIEWDTTFYEYINSFDQPVIVCGDFNVANEDRDIYSTKGKKNKIAGFLDIERENFKKYLTNGFVDIFRKFNNQSNQFTYWDQRHPQLRINNKGWRIDYFLVENIFAERIVNAEIHPNIKGSDHCPISIEISDKHKLTQILLEQYKKNKILSKINETDIILDYTTMRVIIGKRNNIDYHLITSIKNRKEKSIWKVWTCGKNSEKWKPILKNTHCKWSIPILKSNLQKAVRRMNLNQAVQSGLELAILDPNELLRRLPIIAIEDATLIKGTSVIICLMMMKKEYFTIKEITFIVKYITALCSLKKTFYNNENIIPTEISSEERIKNIELEMLFIRISYGGMKYDLFMLRRAMNLFEKECIEDVMHLINESEIPETIDFKHTILLSSLDFHPNPWILNYIARNTNISKERIKELIWHGESALNVRKPATNEKAEATKKEPDWKKILPYLKITYKLIYNNNNQTYKE